jgi:hypothetical protein
VTELWGLYLSTTAVTMAVAGLSSWLESKRNKDPVTFERFLHEWGLYYIYKKFFNILLLSLVGSTTFLWLVAKTLALPLLRNHEPGGIVASILLVIIGLPWLIGLAYVPLMRTQRAKQILQTMLAAWFTCFLIFCILFGLAAAFMNIH